MEVNIVMVPGASWAFCCLFPPSFLHHLLFPCVCVCVCVCACVWPWMWFLVLLQQRDAPVSHQLIILWLYCPGLSTTPVPDCPVTYSEYNPSQVTSWMNSVATCFQCFCAAVPSCLRLDLNSCLCFFFCSSSGSDSPVFLACLKTLTVISRACHPTCLPSHFTV